MGEFLGVASGALYGLGAILFRIGMRHRKRDNGLFMGVAMNVLLIGPLLLMFASSPWQWGGASAFLLSGLFAPWLARASLLKAVRLIGPVRSNAFMLGAPLVTIAISSLLLGERVGATEAAGGALVLGGLALASRSRSAYVESPAPETVVVDGSVVAVPGSSVLERSTNWNRGRLFGVLAAVLLGAGLVVRKVGMGSYPDPLAGAFLASVAALSMILVESTASGRLTQLREENFGPIPWWFVAAGVVSAGAILTQFTAMIYLPIWLVSVLLSTHGLWTVLWSYLFLRGEEEMNLGLLGSIGIALLGVTVLTWPG